MKKVTFIILMILMSVPLNAQRRDNFLVDTSATGYKLKL